MKIAGSDTLTLCNWAVDGHEDSWQCYCFGSSGSIYSLFTFFFCSAVYSFVLCVNPSGMQPLLVTIASHSPTQRMAGKPSAQLWFLVEVPTDWVKSVKTAMEKQILSLNCFTQLLFRLFLFIMRRFESICFVFDIVLDFIVMLKSMCFLPSGEY